MAAVVELRVPMTADRFEAHIQAQVAEGFSGIMLPGRVAEGPLRAIDAGAEDVVICTTGDLAAWIGTVQDYDVDRAEVTVELR
jgi:hypothetical protein